MLRQELFGPLPEQFKSQFGFPLRPKQFEFQFVFPLRPKQFESQFVFPLRPKQVEPQLGALDTEAKQEDGGSGRFHTQIYTLRT